MAFQFGVTTVLGVPFGIGGSFYPLNKLIKVEPSLRQQLRKEVGTNYPMSLRYNAEGSWLTKTISEAC